MRKPILQQFTAVLRSSWAKETSFVPEEWATDNPARGQCLVSSLVVQDYYGGDLMRYRVTGKGFKETHYCNILDDGTILDTTGSQYTDPVILEVAPIELEGYATARDKRLASDSTKAQYEYLKLRVSAKLKKISRERIC